MHQAKGRKTKMQSEKWTDSNADSVRSIWMGSYVMNTIFIVVAMC